MEILVVDAQGGGLGRQLIAAIREQCPGHHITAVGTNSAATANMRKGGADAAATGENAVRVCASRADIIAGPVGIVIADAMLGEITPAMAAAIGQSRAKRILIPVSHCDNMIAGASGQPLSQLIKSAVALIREEGAC